MSDIRGEGYGSTHVWRRDITDMFGGEKGTRYFCGPCRTCFVHLYDRIPDIFEAMRYGGIADVCVPQDPGVTA